LERIITDVSDAVAYRNAGQADAVVERPLLDAGDAGGDRDASDVVQVVERGDSNGVTGKPLMTLGMVTAPPGPVYPVMVMVLLLFV